jgi:hypothetical protein
VKITQCILLVLPLAVLLAGCTVPDLSFAEKVTVQYFSGEDKLSVHITDSDDVSELARVLTEDTHSGSGNCVFTQLQLLFEGDNKTFVLCPATDGCNTVLCNDEHDYYMSSDNKRLMLDILARYEIPLDYSYLYENMYER